MTTRWVFYFDEGNVVAGLESDIQDPQLQEVLAEQKERFIIFQSGKMDVYASLDKVKCVTREVLPENQQEEEVPVIIPEVVE